MSRHQLGLYHIIFEWKSGHFYARFFIRSLVGNRQELSAGISWQMAPFLGSFVACMRLVNFQQTSCSVVTMRGKNQNLHSVMVSLFISRLDVLYDMKLWTTVADLFL